jgi:hydroxymethylpyrimidine pyrophosphatase-like HAD family hydrolase
MSSLNVYRNSTALAKLHKNTRRLAVFSDIDDTFIARDHQTTSDAWQLHRLLETNSIPLVLVSGPEFEAIRQRILTKEVPPADIIMSAVGTAIWVRQANDTWLPDNHFTARLQATGYDRTNVLQSAQQLVHALGQSAPELRLQLQNATQQSPFKVSMYFFATPRLADAIAEACWHYFSPAKIVTCEEIHHNAALPKNAATKKYCLDILAATKGEAISYLIDTLDIKGGYKAGDSGNDTAMLLSPDPLLPILVGGYKADIGLTVRRALMPGSTGPLHELLDGRLIFIDDSPTRRCAQSILHVITARETRLIVE